MFILGLLLFSLSLSAHELGHAFAMRKYGVKIQTISLFGLGPSIATFKLRRWFGDTPVHIKLIPIGAYVAPANNNYLEDLTYSQKIHIFGAGIIANILFAGILLAIWCLGIGKTDPTTLVLVGVTILVGLFPKITSHFVLPVGFFLLFIIVWDIAMTTTGGFMGFHNQMMKDNGSIITIGHHIIKESTTFLRTVKFAAFISFAVGVTNALPLVPLDGGHIANALISRFSGRHTLPRTIYSIITSVLFFYLVFTAIGADIIKIVNHKF